MQQVQHPHTSCVTLGGVGFEGGRAVCLFCEARFARRRRCTKIIAPVTQANSTSPADAVPPRMAARLPPSGSAGGLLSPSEESSGELRGVDVASGAPGSPAGAASAGSIVAGASTVGDTAAGGGASVSCTVSNQSLQGSSD